MNDQELDIILNRIISGYQYVRVNNTLYKLLSPNIDLKIAANILYQKFYEENLYTGFILKTGLKDFIVSHGIISDTLDRDISLTEKKLDQAKIKYYKEFFTHNKNRHKNTISHLKKLINQAYVKKSSMDFLTLENFCENIKNEFILSKTLYDQNNNLVFNNYPEIDYVQFNEIASSIALNVIDISTYKQIARNEYWKKIYYANKNKIFKGCASEYTDEQKALLSISAMYDRINEHPDAPDQSIIDDDDALDGWMLDIQQENLKQKKQKGVDKSLGKGSGAGEVFLMANNQQDIDSVMDMNSAEAMQKIKARSEFQEGETKTDMDFEDVRIDIRKAVNELNKKRM